MLAAFAKVATAVIVLLSCAFGCMSFYLIRRYHESKSLGQQTIFGKVICIFTVTLHKAGLYHGLIYFPFIFISDNSIIKSNPVILRLLAALSCITVLEVFIGLLLSLITKYCSIYHSSYIYALNEDKLSVIVNALLTISPVVLTVVEYTYLTDIVSTRSYQGLIQSVFSDGDNEKIKTKTETTKRLVAISVAFVAVILYGRIRYWENTSLVRGLVTCFQKDVVTENGISQHENQDQEPKVEYKVWVLRLAMSIVFLIAASGFYQITNVQAQLITIYTFTNVILPLLFISNHDPLKKFCISQIRKAFCYK